MKMCFVYYLLNCVFFQFSIAIIKAAKNSTQSNNNYTILVDLVPKKQESVNYYRYCYFTAFIFDELVSRKTSNMLFSMHKEYDIIIYDFVFRILTKIFDNYNLKDINDKKFKDELKLKLLKYSHAKEYLLFKNLSIHLSPKDYNIAIMSSFLAKIICEFFSEYFLEQKDQIFRQMKFVSGLNFFNGRKIDFNEIKLLHYEDKRLFSVFKKFLNNFGESMQLQTVIFIDIYATFFQILSENSNEDLNAFTQNYFKLSRIEAEDLQNTYNKNKYKHDYAFFIAEYKEIFDFYNLHDKKIQKIQNSIAFKD